jgi:hypothetical protein
LSRKELAKLSKIIEPRIRISELADKVNTKRRVEITSVPNWEWMRARQRRQSRVPWQEFDACPSGDDPVFDEWNRPDLNSAKSSTPSAVAARR